MWKQSFVIGLCAVLVSACVAPKVQSRLWSAQAIVGAGHDSKNSRSEYVTLTLPSKIIAGSVNRKSIQDLLQILVDIDKAADLHTTLYITSRGEPSPNAFAGHVQSGYIVAINMSMVRMLETHQEMYAALLAHEVAHHVLKHYEATENRKAILGVGSAAIGVALAVVSGPIAGGLSGVAASLIDSKFSREQEKEADKLSIQLMHQAGYPLHGAILFYAKLSANSKEGITFLNSHPSNQDRMKYVRQVVSSFKK